MATTTQPRKKHRGECGYVAERMNPFVPGEKVTIYRAAEQGIDAGGMRYAVVCDAHGMIIAAGSVPQARSSMKHPEDFCEACRALGQ